MPEIPDVVVVGSVNQDLVVPVPHHPTIGETVLGEDHLQIPGGKGANQAVAAARLGSQVTFVGRVGTDSVGSQLRKSLENEKVNCQYLINDQNSPSGIALIGVNKTGDNTIIVSPGANSKMNAEDILTASTVLKKAPVTLLQFEIPIEAVETAIAISEGIVILNPAPTNKNGIRLLKEVDVLVPNLVELSQLVQSPKTTNLNEVENMARSLPTRQVIVTLGEYGALLVTNDRTEAIQAPKVETIDTTAAGDAFCGALADSLSRGTEITEAVHRAVHAGAISVTNVGAQTSLPTAQQVADSILNNKN